MLWAIDHNGQRKSLKLQPVPIANALGRVAALAEPTTTPLRTSGSSAVGPSVASASSASIAA